MDNLFSPFRERVRAQFSQLSPAQQQVARHLGDDPGCLPFGTVASLAAATGTSEATDFLVQSREIARAADSTAVVITDSHLSRPGQLGDVVLEAVIRSPAATDSYVAALSLATALLSGAPLRQPERVRANLTQLEEVYARWNLYVDD